MQEKEHLKKIPFDLQGKERVCYIFGAGAFFGLKTRPRPGDLVIAADGGLRHLKALGLRPDILIGDLDSLREEEGRSWGLEGMKEPERKAPLSKEQEPHSPEPEPGGRIPLTFRREGDLIRIPVIKDLSDSAAALRIGRERGYRRFYLYGCTGGRMAHTMASLQDLAALSREGLTGYLFGEREVITAITDSCISFPAGMEGFLSVFSVNDRSSGVLEEGLKYTVADGSLENSFPLGLSNEFTGQAARVAVEQGTLLIFIDIRSIEGAGVRV